MSLPAVHKPIEIQRRLVELGRIRMGEKGPRGEPRQRTTFRFTSASRALLDAAAQLYGGQVRPWKDAPDEGYFELATDAREVDILIPPTLASYSQSFELWDRGGLLRRCDAKTEAVSGQPCLCAAANERLCQPTTRVSVMLPKLPGLGVWRLDSHGWDAAATLPATLETLGALTSPGTWIPAVLRIERKSSRRRGPDGRPQTRRFIVPRIDILGGTIGQAIEGGLAVTPAPRLTAGETRHERVARPELPAGPDLPSETGWQAERRPRGARRPDEGRATAARAEGSAAGADAPDATSEAASAPLTEAASGSDEAVTAEFSVQEIDEVLDAAVADGKLWEGPQ